MQTVKEQEFLIIEQLSKEYSINSLCQIMMVSRSGYYKWLKNRNMINRWEKQRKDIAELAIEIHHNKKSYGYHRIAAQIQNQYGWVVSHNLVHKVCKTLKIWSKLKHYDAKHNKKRDEHKIYPNLVNGEWQVNKPFEIVVSDGTMITFNGKSYDWNYYIDVFDRSIVGSDVTPFKHGNDFQNHKRAFMRMIKEKEKRGYKDQVMTFHSDQGAIYSSTIFNDCCNNYNIKRSMSRAATPTDNPIIESKNGWLKQEMKLDFNDKDYKSVEEYIEAVIKYNNYERPSHPLKYKTPIQYRTELGFK